MKVIVSKSKIEAVADNIRNAIGSADKLTLEQMANVELGSGGGANTSDATATASDILLGKTAYSSGGKIEGTIATYEGAFEGSAVNEITALVDGSATDIVCYATTVRGYAFNGLQKLIAANLPNATTVGICTFRQCFNVKTINLPMLTAIPNYCFEQCQKATDIYAPNVKTIGNYAFDGCNLLPSADYPNVTSVGDYAFQNNKAMVTCKLPKVTLIPNCVFKSCTALTTIHLDSVETINRYAFEACSSLTDIYLGYNGVVTLGEDTAFSYAKSGCKIHVRPEQASKYTVETTNWGGLIQSGKIVIVGDYND